MVEDREPRVLGDEPSDPTPAEIPAAETERTAEPEAESPPETESPPEAQTEPEAEAEPAPADDVDSPEPASQRDAESSPEPPPASASEPADQPINRPKPLRKKSQAPVFHVAGFWRRLAAAIIDLAIIVPVAYLLCWIAGSLTGIGLPASRHHGVDFWLDLLLASDPALLGGLGLTLAVGAIYAMVFQVTTAATPGMRVLKTRIIDIYGDPPSTARAMARTAGYLAGVATLALGFLWIGFDSEKRGIHDWLSGTYVVKA